MLITKSARYFKISADKGNSNGLYFYARMLENGFVIPMNKLEAIKYYKAAVADEFCTLAMADYARILENGEVGVIEANKKEALKYYQKAADNGDKDTFDNYSRLPNEGVELPKEDSSCTIQ